MVGMPFIDLLIVVGVGYAAAVPFFFARGLKPGARGAVFVLLGAVVLGSVVLLETGNLAIRYVAVALPLIIFLLHMWDLHMDPGRGTRLSLWAYIVFLGECSR